jgi:hypothetical protein
MSVWRRTRTEVAGAWRSMRYDMGRRPSEPPADGHDVTSTGMNTFGGASWALDPGYLGPEPTEMPIAGRMPAPRRRSPRRAMAVSAFGVLTVAGAAGAYLVVVNGLVPLRDEGPAAAGTLPPATAETGIGRSPRAPRIPVDRTPGNPAPVMINTTPADRPPAVVVPRPPRKASPIRTRKPANQICCVNPPVPTPTAPASSPSPTPSATTSPSASASGSGNPSGNPSETPEPRKSQKPGHHRRPR